MKCSECNLCRKSGKFFTCSFHQVEVFRPNFAGCDEEVSNERHDSKAALLESAASVRIENRIPTFV